MVYVFSISYSCLTFSKKEIAFCHNITEQNNSNNFDADKYGMSSHVYVELQTAQYPCAPPNCNNNSLHVNTNLYLLRRVATLNSKLPLFSKRLYFFDRMPSVRRLQPEMCGAQAC